MTRRLVLLAGIVFLFGRSGTSLEGPGSILNAASANPPNWDLAQKEKFNHRFSTLFTAQDVRRHLSSEEGLQKADEWCKQTGVTHVYIETFRDRYQADQSALLHAKMFFLNRGFDVSGYLLSWSEW